MEALTFCFYEQVFSDLDRGCLMARYKRREIVEYFSTLIEGCSSGDGCGRQSACRRAVRAAIRFHESSRAQNGDVCLLGKYHNILYVAVKLCYDWKLEDNDTVCRLLRDIYSCEKTFERLIIGSIFGTRVTHLISGWKSDFANRDECLKATEYFLDHAARGGLVFEVRGERKAMAEVPMESYGGAPPARVCVQAARFDALALLVAYGASPHVDPRRCGLQLLLRHLQERAESRPSEPLPEQLLKCLNVFVKVLPRVPLIVYDPTADDDDDYGPATVHPAVLAGIPIDKTGFYPPGLQHLCRCVIRERLASNGRIPYGVSQLGLPQSLETYVNFKHETDFLSPNDIDVQILSTET